MKYQHKQWKNAALLRMAFIVREREKKKDQLFLHLLVVDTFDIT